MDDLAVFTVSSIQVSDNIRKHRCIYVEQLGGITHSYVNCLRIVNFSLASIFHTAMLLFVSVGHTLIQSLRHTNGHFTISIPLLRRGFLRFRLILLQSNGSTNIVADRINFNDKTISHFQEKASLTLELNNIRLEYCIRLT